MIQWEYKIVELSSSNTEEKLLYSMGQDGWQLCCIFFGVNCYVVPKYYFKRPIPQPSPSEKIFDDVLKEVDPGHMQVKTTS